MENNDIKWWYYLSENHSKPSLMDNENIDAYTFIVRHEHQYNRFAAFKSSSHFFMRYKNIPKQIKTFYEIIHKELKPYFDIDIDDVEVDGDQLIKDLYDVLKKLISQNFIYFVCNSHTKTKKSYHVILADLYLSDYTEMKNLLSSVMEELKNPNKKYIDSNVYKSSQHLRLLGSHKYQKNNTKIFDEELTQNYFIPVDRRDLEAKEIYDFKLSLASDITGCRYLCGFQNKYNVQKELLEGEVKFKTKNTLISDYQDIINQIQELMYLNFDNVEFTFDQIKDNYDNNILIVLRSKNPYYCKLCDSIHEHENPYIHVKNSEVYFNCRRYDSNGKNKKNGNMLLGKLKSLSCKDLLK